jgi:hypothetical protein
MRYYEYNGYGIRSPEDYEGKKWFDVYEGTKQ